jgi:hypothetical protein
MDKRTQISNLDFVSIKSSLIDFLNNQEEFKGYSFEGSALNILMDLLSYNTYYNGIYNNLALNESFLDTAIKRASVVSLAKNLGYFAKSPKAAKATINIKLSVEDYTSDKLIIPRNTIISAKTSDGTNISFVTTKVTQLEPYEFDDTGEIISYSAQDVEIYQGVFNTYSHIVGDPLDKITIPYSNIDTDFIRAFILKDISDTTGIQFEWLLCKSITEVDETSRVFFINETPNNQYSIQFGDGIFGKKIEYGNVILFELLLTTGSLGNNIGINDTVNYSSFSLSGYEIETVQYSSGGTDKEDIERIRQNALRNYSVQDRAVTTTDYEAMILKSFGSVESVRCWGGEDNDPPQYGKVYASIKPYNAPFLSTKEKADIIEYITQNKSTVGMTLEIKDPDILYLNFNLNIKYDPSITSDSELKIKEQIETNVKNYALTNYTGFDDDFYASEFLTNVSTFHPSIVSSNSETTMEKRVYPTVGIKQKFNIEFENKLYHPESYYLPVIVSTTFYTNRLISGALVKKLCYIEDYNGVLKLYYSDIDISTGATKKTYVEDIGTVDYETGSINFEINISDFSSDGNYIGITARPNDVDIFTDKDTILAFERLSNRNVMIDLKKVYRNTIQNSSAATRIYND